MTNYSGTPPPAHLLSYKSAFDLHSFFRRGCYHCRMVLKATAGLTLCCLGIGLSVRNARQSAAAEIRLSQAYPPISHSCVPPEDGALEQFEVAEGAGGFASLL